MKAYVYLAIVGFASGCAFGVTPDQELPHDGGIIKKADAGGVKDAGVTPHDAGEEDSAVELPDVSQPLCSSLPLGTGEPSCDTCISSSCCDEDQTCGFDQDCIGFIDCMNGCFPLDGGAPDPNCESSCQATYPNGASELDSLDVCMQSSCPNDCF